MNIDTQNIMKTYNRKSIVFEKGQGVWLFDDQGEKYLDFVSGVAVNCLGHSHPTFVNEMQKQVAKLTHVSNLYWTKEQVTLGKRLCNLSNLSSAFFCNSGTEALETALKIAKKHGQSIASDKNKVIVMEKAFHGRTIGALSLTFNNKYKDPFGSLLTDIVAVPINDITALKQIMDEKVCAVVIEPIQGEGGIYSLDASYLKASKDLCESNNALLVFDEVQCGMGRSGHVFAHQKKNIQPDVLCLAKGLGAGMPIGAVLVNQKADVLVAGDHGSTFGGNSLASCAGNIVLDHITKASFLEQVNESSAYLKEKLEQLNDSYDFLVEVRGEGLMLGLETKYLSKDIVSLAMDEKLLLIGAGEKTVRIIPPLVITNVEIDIFIEKFEKILNKLIEHKD